MLLFQHSLKVIGLLTFASILFFALSFHYKKGNEECPTQPKEVIIYIEKSDILDDDELLCDVAIGIHTAPQFVQSRMKDQLQSWVPRVCKKKKSENVLAVGVVDTSLPIASFDPHCGNNYEDNCCKSMAGLQELYTRSQGKDIQWFAKVDDDTFVVPNNLHKILSRYNASEKILLGRVLSIAVNATDRTFTDAARFSDVDHHQNDLEPSNILYYVSGGAGYVLSKGFVETLLHDKAIWKATVDRLCTKIMHEDIVMGELCRLHECQVARIYGAELLNYVPDQIRHNPFVMFHADNHKTDFFWMFDMLANNNL